jgi:hypothetical protein
MRDPKLVYIGAKDRRSLPDWRIAKSVEIGASTTYALAPHSLVSHHPGEVS